VNRRISHGPAIIAAMPSTHLNTPHRGGADGSVSVFDGATAALLGSVVVPHRTLAAADFLTDGRTVVIAAYDDGIYLWDTGVEHAIEQACRTAGRDLTTTEWRDNFGGRPYRKVCP
jgi:hypothetical protein